MNMFPVSQFNFSIQIGNTAVFFWVEFHHTVFVLVPGKGSEITSALSREPVPGFGPKSCFQEEWKVGDHDGRALSKIIGDMDCSDSVPILSFR